MTLIRTMETPAGDKGYLQVQVVNIENNFPIQGARVSISYKGDPGRPLEEVMTNSSGQTENVSLNAPPKSYSLAPGPVPGEQPADAGPADALTLTLALTLTADGRPVYFSWQDSGRTGDAAGTGSLLAPALALLGVDEFTDWQPVDWGGRLPGAGETAYSPAAQLYVSVNAGGGLTVGAASMTPEQFAALLD